MRLSSPFPILYTSCCWGALNNVVTWVSFIHIITLCCLVTIGHLNSWRTNEMNEMITLSHITQNYFHFSCMYSELYTLNQNMCFALAIFADAAPAKSTMVTRMEVYRCMVMCRLSDLVIMYLRRCGHWQPESAVWIWTWHNMFDDHQRYRKYFF